MPLTPADLGPVWLSLRLAFVTTVFLLILGMPLAWWLAQRKSVLCAPISAIVTLPLVLPPSVLGFYVLVALGPSGPIGAFTQLFGIETLNFTFTGLVVGSVIYSLPFMVQPLQNAFEAVGTKPMEVAATLRAGPLDAFFSVIFGVVLMIGGNIPGETQVVSTEIFTYVEGMEYDKAHWLAGGMLVFSFFVLLSLTYFERHGAVRSGR